MLSSYGSSQHLSPLIGRTQKVCFWRLCVLCFMTCLPYWQLSDGARLRCGSDLLADLMFVCGDRGIYLGKGTWSGYGARPRGKGIVDHCCQSAGCDLQHLERYCATPKRPTSPVPTATSPVPTTKQQFEVVFQKRLLMHLGAPNSEKRLNARRKPQYSPRRKKQISSSRKGTNRQQATSVSPLPTQKPL